MARDNVLSPLALPVGGGPLPHLITPWWQAERPGRWLLGSVFLLAAVGLGSISAVNPSITLAAGCGLALVAGVWARPALAAYLLIGLTPLIAGIDRGSVIPIFRLSEALALVLGAALAARGLARLRTRGVPALRLDRVELSMILLAVTSSVVPLLWMAVRQREITHDDLLYSLVMWKYLALYVIVRLAVTTVEQVRRCLWLSVAAACAVAVIAVLQALNLFGVPGLLATYYAPFGDTGALEQARGSSTLALPAATADLLIYNLAITAGLLMLVRRNRAVLAAAAALLVFGVLSAGQFSSTIGLLVGVICIAAATGAPRLLFYLVLVAGVAAKALEPVIRRRLSGFESASGLPVSWIGRLRNLRTYFWPNVFSDWNVLFGVRPAARVPVTTDITGYVWIESGYTWLLWGGGIPLVASFLLFVHAAAKRGWQAARRHRDAIGVAGVATYVAVIVTTVLMAFDPHLTYRGSADALFFLLALAVPRKGATVVAAPAMTRADVTEEDGKVTREGVMG